MDDENIKNSRLFVAAMAIVRQRYPDEIASVILEDNTLPAWEEAVEEASAVLNALKLDTLFIKVLEVDEKIEAADKRLKESELQYNNLVRDMESEVLTRTNRAVADRERFLQGEIGDLEDEVLRLDETVRHYEDAILVHKTIKRTGPIYRKDYDYLRDEDFKEDYGDEAYWIRNTN